MDFLINEKGAVTLAPKIKAGETDYFEQYLNGAEKNERILQITGANRKTDASKEDDGKVRIRYFDYNTKPGIRKLNIETVISTSSGDMMIAIVCKNNTPVADFPRKEF